MDTIIQTSKKKVFFRVLMLIATLISGIIIYQAFSSPMARSVELDALRISEVRTQSFEDFIYLNATVQPKNTAHITAVDGGIVDEVYVEEGELVKKGQAIAKLANTNLQLNMIFNQSQITEQINNLNNLELQLEKNRLIHKEKLATLDFEILMLERKKSRLQPLKASGGVSTEALQEVEDELKYKRLSHKIAKEAQISDLELQQKQMAQITASVKDLENNLKLVQKNLDKLTVRAPINGKITGLDLKIGQSLRHGALLAKVDGVNEFVLDALIDEFYLERIFPQQTASIEIKDKKLPLTVKKVLPTVTNGQFKAQLELEKNANQVDLVRGQSLQVRLTLNAKSNALVVENGGFLESTNGRWIYVLDTQEKRLRKQEIRIGNKNPEFIEITHGLRAGQEVVVSPYEDLQQQDIIGYDN